MQKRTRSNRPNERRGAVVVMAAVCLVISLACVAFALDLGLLYTVRGQAQRCADAAAVAGAVAQFDARRHQLIYVDASGEQVDDLIADLDERRELFAAVHRQLVDGPPLAPRRPQGAHVGAAASDEPLPSTADRPEQDAAPRGVARRLTIGDLPVDATGPAAVARAMQDDSMVSVAETDDDTEQSASFGVLFVVRPPRAEGE